MTRNTKARAAAQKLGLVRYNTGLPCKRGHMAERFTSTKACVVCHRAAIDLQQAKNPQKTRAIFAAWRTKNLSYDRSRLVAKSAIRRARMIGLSCSCCSKKDLSLVYQNCPIGCEVDHQMALALGGKHCTKNLQILTVAAHKAKTLEDLRKIAEQRRAA